ncbi:MAG: hypothetical protein IJX26_01450 [Clostridia bacterium]|nr:hypothetical protein [Clostridia bacterium]
MPNGDCLIGRSIGGLYYLNSTDFSVNTLLSSEKVESITDQEDGTYLIKTTGDFDFEYDYVTSTLRLVYTVA